MLPFKIPGHPTAGWLVLIGGGDFSSRETEEIDRFLIEKMPRENRRVAFLPTASGSAEYARHFGDYIRELDETLEVTNVPVYRGRDARRAPNLQTIRGAGMVYVGGGVADGLLATVRSTPVFDAVVDVLQQGGVVAAIGAAATAFGAIAATREGHSIDDAFDFVTRTAVHAPFEGSDRPLRVLVGDPRVDLVLAVPPRTALAISPERDGVVVGNGSIGVVRRP